VEEALRALIFYGFVGLLVLLRFDAQRFGAAEYDDEDATGWRDWLLRLSWYVFAFGLLAVIYWMHYQPLTVLRLQAGDDLGRSLLVGFALAALGSLLAVSYAWLRYRDVKLPPGRRYPAGLLTSVGTAFVDEAVFRGVVLGLLLVANWPVDLAVGFQAVLYVIATRIAGRGRSLGMVLIFLLLGLVGGWVTIATGGIGAALLGHALTRFALFVATGHAGQLRDVTSETEAAVEASDLTPEGWEVVPDRDQTPGYWR
jgi:hypothetical protein